MLSSYKTSYLVRCPFALYIKDSQFLTLESEKHLWNETMWSRHIIISMSEIALLNDC
jgi:hypothetical protein